MLCAFGMDRGLFREKTDDEIGRLGVEPLFRLVAEQRTDGGYVTTDHHGVTFFAIQFAPRFVVHFQLLYLSRIGFVRH